ncbi:glycosyltransferase family 39 protein [Paucibacter sp. Y2R2-4]|uniref:glycosyltransferase family 39 protein n=1 Tax=Paucibacter sp. Y2R2-4 TaxID=2893553 RepID=UPI0021E3A13B|nr:glycosyltransferase family 39 protein [Paucibacter sp. Y2R2-4]MCV2349011.1 glycosyltransferase family 39 protein [Paucibacter sp. Y2R2-4]
MWTNRPAMPGLELPRGLQPAGPIDSASPTSGPSAKQVLPFGLDAANAQHMAWLTWGFMAFHLLMWTVLASLSHRAPPWDNVEQLVWQQSLEWGYYKHPPFPTWWVYGWTSLLGRSMWVTFFAAQLSVVLMQLFIWRIALLVTTPARAFVSVALSSLLIYHGVHGIMANHNTIQLMPVGLLLWLSLLAVRSQGQAGQVSQMEQLGRWILVGAAAALCLLSKYSALIWLAVIGAWMLQDHRMRSWRAWAGVGLALLVCAALMLPHIDWLLRDGSPGLAYADRAVHGQNDADDIDHWGRLFKFLVIQLGRVLPLLIGLGLLMAWLKRGAKTTAAEAPAQTVAAEPKSEWTFVLFMTLGPVVLTSLVGVAGVRLGSAWAATFFVMAGVLALYVLRRQSATDQLVRKALWVCVGMELLLALGMVIGGAWGADRIGHAARSNFPAARLARKLDVVWKEHARTPLRVVIGETWLAGNVSVRSKTQPMVFIDADPQKSPWIKPHMVSDCGALLVIDRRDMANPLDPRVAALLEQASSTGTLSLPWSRRGNAPKLEVQWAILEAKNPSACPL